MSKLLHWTFAIVVIATTHRNNPLARNLGPGGGPGAGSFFRRADCELFCTDPGKFCAQDTNPPWNFYCTDGTDSGCAPGGGRIRNYFIQVELVEWNYLPSGENQVDENNDYLLDSLAIGNATNRVGSVYWKCLYKRYTDGFYGTEIPSLPSHGFVGPTIRGETHDTIKIHIRNLCPAEISMHPHGILYNKSNEGAYYIDGTTGTDKLDDRIPYGESRILTWHMTQDFAPTDDDPNCIPFGYHGHNLPAHEINSGLLGLLVVCKRGTLDVNGIRNDVDRELVLYVDSIDEALSLMLNNNLLRCGNPAICNSLLAAGDPAFMESLKKDSVNGYMYANGPPFEVCLGERVAWYIFSLEAELHAVEIHGNVFDQKHTRKSVIGIWSATFAAAETYHTKPGFWLVSCRNSEHNRNGMNVYLNVSDCGTGPIVEPLTGTTRNYFLNAESTSWNYGPTGLNLYDGGSLTAAGSDSEPFFISDATHIGGTYEKGRFVEYTDASFLTNVTRGPEEVHLALAGPVIRAEVGDTIVVEVKNSLPFNVSLYLQGVVFDKSEDGLWEKAGTGVMGGKIVPPGSQVTYTYTVPPSVGPGADDPTCRPYLYYSAMNTERDQNTGLYGPVLICKSGGLDPNTGRQKYVDREMFLIFGDNDENLSWLIDTNIANAGMTAAVKADPAFVESNVMRSINGRMYGNLEGLDVCRDEKVMWHVLSVGGNTGLHTAVFNGNNLLIEGIYRDAHVTIPEVTFSGLMMAENVGNWSLVCGNNEHFVNGEKAVYTVDLCGAAPVTLYNTATVTRTYYIAADELYWDYSPYHTIHPITGENYSDPLSSQYNRVRQDGILLGSNYLKALYREYTDNTFTTAVPKQTKLGVLGPTLYGAEGDIIKVVFKNNASRPYSMHAQGLRYLKDYEGYVYEDGHAPSGDSVAPGAIYEYYWEVPPTSTPTVTGPNCQGSLYHSAVDPVKDTYSGLVGVFVSCKAGVLDPNNLRHDYIANEFPILMLAFDENLSWYLQDNINQFAPGTNPNTDEFIESNKYDSINGYIYDNNPALIMNVGTTVAWYVCGLGLSEDIHTLHFHAQTFTYRTTREHEGDVIEVFPHTCETVEMFCGNPGRWLMHCHIGQHTLDGMVGTFTVL